MRCLHRFGCGRWVLLCAALGLPVLLAAGFAIGADCNNNGVDDAADLSAGTSADCNGNGLPDECDVFPVSFAPVPGTPLGTSVSPGAITAADLDGDGAQDLAVVSVPFNDGYLSVFLRAGLADFSTQFCTPILTNNAPNGVVAADFDGDGGPDLAVLYYGGFLEIGGVDVFQNPKYNEPLLGGCVVLLPTSPFIGPFRPNAFTAADFDGDGDTDLAVTADLNVAVLLNDGAGAFGYAANSPFLDGTSPYAIVTGDFDGDGRPDLAITDDTANEVLVALNAGAAQFPAVAHVATATEPVAIATADLDGDSDLDLVTANEGADSISILINSSGTFTLQSSIPVGQEPSGVAAADFDGDGHTDIVVANTKDDDMTVLLGPAFTNKRSFETGGAAPGPVIAADLNGDGRPDVAVVNNRSNTVSVLLAGESASADADDNGTPDECRAACGNGLLPMLPLMIAGMLGLMLVAPRRGQPA